MPSSHGWMESEYCRYLWLSDCIILGSGRCRLIYRPCNFVSTTSSHLEPSHEDTCEGENNLHLFVGHSVRTLTLELTGRQYADMCSVISVTELRILALRDVTSNDFSYSKGYLALLSTVGALLSIITGCAPALQLVPRSLRVFIWIPSHLWPFRIRAHRDRRLWYSLQGITVQHPKPLEGTKLVNRE